MAIIVHDPHPTTGRVRVTLECAPGRTKQEFGEETDINFILKQWIKTGQAPYMAAGVAFGDFSGTNDFQEAMETVTETEQQFAALPSHIRDRFGNDANQLLAFLEKPENLAEAQKLGIVKKPDDEVVPIPNNSPKVEAKSVPTKKKEGEETPPD